MTPPPRHRHRARTPDAPARLDASLLDSPALFPKSIDVVARRLLFVPMTRRTYRASPFLDDRMVVAGDTGVWQPVRLVESLVERRRARQRPVNLVLHTAFCGSTALATALDIPGVCFACREPAPLHQLACVKRDIDDPETATPPGVPEPERIAADAGVVGALCARTFDPGELPLVKLTDACGAIAADLMRALPGSRAVMLYDPPVEFAVSFLKSDDRREHLHTVADRARVDLGGVARPEDDASAAALAWLGHARAYTALHDEFPDRVRCLSSTALFGAPGGALGAVAEHFRLRLSRRRLERLAGAAFAADAKRPGEAFDLGARAERRVALREDLAPEIEAMRARLAELAAPADPVGALPAALPVEPG